MQKLKTTTANLVGRLIKRRKWNKLTITDLQDVRIICLSCTFGLWGRATLLQTRFTRRHMRGWIYVQNSISHQTTSQCIRLPRQGGRCGGHLNSFSRNKVDRPTFKNEYYFIQNKGLGFRNPMLLVSHVCRQSTRLHFFSCRSEPCLETLINAKKLDPLECQS